MKCNSRLGDYCPLLIGDCSYVEKEESCPYKNTRLLRLRQMKPREVHDHATIQDIDIGLAMRFEWERKDKMRVGK